MFIQWYPGHMTKAMRMMQDAIKQVDCVIYVLDCRAIASCLNPKFDDMIKDKPTLYILGKSDLVESGDVKQWTAYFAAQGKNFVVADNLSGRQRNFIVDKLKQINRQMLEKYAAKGANVSIRAMVVGVPNTGKSTLINSLCVSKRTLTGNRPGVTRGKQWVSLAEGIELLDTPGVVPPAFEDQQRALHLAFIGSIKEEILHLDDLAIEIIKYCREKNYERFCERYKLDKIDDDNVQVFDDIAKNRGYLLGKKGYDYDRTAKAIVYDFKSGKLGKIMLDFPSDLV
ncbi:MAG: ribosome biogenesis GTPase YlqF [Clostridia bacterium]|nr:ribosome biogenesis GTPase YlqF [Clostridia bacterium]MDE7328134.1 ribosome biogenesis GTPase YlqF [Clostridia bacterium]